MLVTFDEQAVIEALSFPRLVEALDETFRRGGKAPLRSIHDVAGGEHPAGTLLMMPAWDDEDYLGVKLVNIFPGNVVRGEAGLHSVYNLFDRASGRPLAIMSADPITARRTAAASALAADYLARANATRLLVVGAGAVASMLPDAYATVRPLSEVRVWNRGAERARALVNRLRQAGHVARVSDDLEADVAWADMVTCATFSSQPLVYRQWLRPGSHLDLIGGFKPDMQEADPACFSDTSVFVDTEEAVQKAGDLLRAQEQGLFHPAMIRARLRELCSGTHGGRASAGEITVYKAVGSAIEDLVAARLVYETRGRLAQGDGTAAVCVESVPSGQVPG